MKVNNGKCLNMVSIVQAIQSTDILTLLDGTLVNHKYVPNNVGTHLQWCRQRKIEVNEVA